MRLGPYVCVVLALGGCNAIFGVDNLTFQSGGGGVTGGTMATGGGGAGGASSGSGGASSGSGGGSGATGPCGTFALLADDFQDQLVGPVWEEHTAGSTISEDGQLVVQVGTGTGAQYGAIRSSFTYDLRDSAVSVTVDQTLGTGKTYLQVSVFGQGSLTLQRMGESLVVLVGIHVVAITPFDAAEHVLWRIREDGGTLHVETASESMEFTEQYSAPVTALANDPTDLRFTDVTVGGSEPESSDTARFDDFNGGTASGHYCKSESLVSTFGVSLRPAWVEPTGQDPCLASVDDGELRLTLDQDPGHCAVTSSSRFDPQGSFFSARVRRTGNASPGIRVVATAVVAAELVILDDELAARVNTGPSLAMVATAPYDATVHCWLSMREQDGTLWFETSPDGNSWSPFASVDMPFAPAPVQLQLFMADGDQNTCGYFDDVNVSGPSPR